MGLDNASFFHDLAELQISRGETRNHFRTAAQELTVSPHEGEVKRGEHREPDSSSAPTNEFVPIARDRVSAGAISFLDALFFDITNTGSAPKANEPWPGERDKFEVAAEEATKQAQHYEREEVDAEWNQRQKAIRGE
jgi:hypothetical protein